MDVLYNSAPELVGLLSELCDAHEELERKVNPLLGKVKKGEAMLEGGMHYLEVKQLLLLSYCQAITFYLLLKSEGQPVRDHPVLARLIEIKIWLDKMKQLDGNLPSDFGEILNKYNWVAAVAFDSFSKEYGPQPVLVEGEAAAVVVVEIAESLKDNENQVGKRKFQIIILLYADLFVGGMLEVRAALEEKLKQKGVFSSIAAKIDKSRKLLKPLNEKLESYDDFGDDIVNIEGAVHGLNNGHASKLSQLAANPIKSKVISGVDDLPRRDDIGERRRNHDLRVLAGAGIKSQADARATISDAGDVKMEDSETGDSEDDFYKQVKEKRAAKLAAKAEIYSRSSTVPSLVDTETVDGKRHISYQMEKNRGLTRARKKLIKNPRKKYKLKHQKAAKSRKGQVREVRKPLGPYGGEATAINAEISRSTRFKN